MTCGHLRFVGTCNYCQSKARAREATAGLQQKTYPKPDSEQIADWLEGLSRNRACPPERQDWYTGVADDIRNGVWKRA